MSKNFPLPRDNKVEASAILFASFSFFSNADTCLLYASNCACWAAAAFFAAVSPVTNPLTGDVILSSIKSPACPQILFLPPGVTLAKFFPTNVLFEIPKVLFSSMPNASSKISFLKLLPILCAIILPSRNLLQTAQNLCVRRISILFDSNGNAPCECDPLRSP